MPNSEEQKSLKKVWAKMTPAKRKRFAQTFFVTSLLSTVSAVTYGVWADASSYLVIAGVTNQVTAHTGSVTTTISSMTASQTSTIQKTTADISSALNVTTKQEKASGDAITDSIMRTAQTQAAALQVIDQSEKAKEASLKFGVTGQGFRACTTLARNQSLAAAPVHALNVATSLVSNTQNGPGRLAADADEEAQVRIQQHRDKFCTASEAQQGICKLSSLPGGDTNAGLLFESVYPDSKEAEARIAVRQNILGPNDKALPRASGTNLAGDQYLMALNHKASMLAFPAYSLAVIDAQNLKQFKDEKGNLVSANEILEQTVSRYYGGDEAKSWQKSMMVQEPRGLLVELARLNGVETWMDMQSLEQGLRIEGLLATLLIASAEPMKKKVDDLSSKAKIVDNGNKMPRF